MPFLGIVIEQSLNDASIIQAFDVLADKRVGSWRFLLVSVPEAEIERKMKKLQNHMIGITEDCWYAHFF